MPAQDLNLPENHGLKFFIIPFVAIKQIMPFMADMHRYKYFSDQLFFMSSGSAEMGDNQIKRISVKEPTWKELHNLKSAGQSYDELIAEMISHERDLREWKQITEIDENGEFVDFELENYLEDN